MSSEVLREALTQAVPIETTLCFRHIVTPPNPCPPLFAPPSGRNDILTTCQKHLLVISTPPANPGEHTAVSHHTVETRPSEQHGATDVEREDRHNENNEGCQGHKGENNGEIILFALEVFVYDEASLTTIFVSKADSTGYLYKLARPPGAHEDKRSLVKLISTAFLSHIISLQSTSGHEQKKVVLSLFARAQDQYLFPGSIENPHKHVLNDRDLIKWWCRVVDPLLLSDGRGENAKMADAYLIVPGCDEHETKSFFPRPRSSQSSPHSRQGQWHNSYPLKEFCPRPDAPPRCLVPRFEDDPKARFLADLDAEIPKVGGASHNTRPAPQARAGDDSRPLAAQEWRSIKTLDQFWELMAFRQECSAGRLVGFLWLVVRPHVTSQTEAVESSPQQNQGQEKLSSSTVCTTHGSSEETEDRVDMSKESNPLSHTTTLATNINAETHTLDRFPSSAVPESAHSRVLISEENYDKLFDHLLTLDFNTESNALKSTWSYIQQLSHLSYNYLALQGALITGIYSAAPAAIGNAMEASSSSSAAPKVLSSNLIRKRKAASNQDSAETARDSPADAPPVNVLGAGAVRKKKKNT